MAPKRARTSQAASSSRPPQDDDTPALVHPPAESLRIKHLTAKQRAVYTKLRSRPIYKTQFLDEDTLRCLGLYDEVQRLLAVVGWTEFVQCQADATIRLTLEFLSTLDVTDHQNQSPMRIRFQLLNQPQDMTLREWREIFHLSFPLSSEDDRVPNVWSGDLFWSQITGVTEIYNPSSAKASRIRHPCLRYIHRVMAHTLFGRHDSAGVVRRPELWIMERMLRPGRPIDTAVFMLRHLQSVANRGGPIVIGGLITHLARGLGLEIDQIPTVAGDSKLNINALLRMKIIMTENHRFKLLFHNSTRTSILPNPTLVGTQTEESWLYPLPDEDAEPEPVLALHDGDAELEPVLALHDVEGPAYTHHPMGPNRSSTSHPYHLHDEVRRLADEVHNLNLAQGRMQEDITHMRAGMDQILELLRSSHYSPPH